MVESLTGQGVNVRHACRCLGVTESGYYAWRGRPTSPMALRRIFLATQITEVHRDSGGVHGAHRVTAELRHGREIMGRHNAVADIMRELGIKGLPNRRLPRAARIGNVGCQDLVRRAFRRDFPDELWMTDITEHPTREGKVYCWRGDRRLLAAGCGLVGRQHPDHGAGHQRPSGWRPAGAALSAAW